MTSRRELLKAGLAAAAWPAAVRAGSARVSAPTVPLYKVLYDTRFPASIEFARRATVRGLAVQAMAGDITRFWYDDLYHRWRKEPVAIAGLTAHGALFCLERLAWDQRMRVVYRGEHLMAPEVVHRFDGPEPLVSVARGAVAEPGWATALADVVAACPSEPKARAPATEAAVTRSALFSWVIAPVRCG